MIPPQNQLQQHQGQERQHLGREGEVDQLPSTSPPLLTPPELEYFTPTELEEYFVPQQQQQQGQELQPGGPHNDGESQDEEWLADILAILADDPPMPLDEL